MIHRGPQRIDIRPAVHLVRSQKLFGRGIIDRAGKSRPMAYRVLAGLGNPQVGKFHSPVICEHDIGGLDISVDHIVGGG